MSFPILYYCLQQSLNRVNERLEIKQHQNVSPRTDIRGFNYDYYKEGKKVISIEADRFNIDKKKVGFFRFGLLNAAKLENAIIHIYGIRHSENKPDKRLTNKKDQIRPHNNLIVDKVFLKEALPAAQVKRISSIKIEPVHMKLHDEHSVVTRITASSAVVRFKKRDVLFKGNVRVNSGDSILKTDQIRFDPERALITTNNDYILYISGKQFKGNRLSTDIFLNPSIPSFSLSYDKT